MRILIVEDDYVSFRLLKEILWDYGECVLAIDGLEAVAAFTSAMEEGKPFDLVCLDIMMPEMDGQQVLKAIRHMESEKGIRGLDGVKIIMITVLNDYRNIRQAFAEQCEAYLTKPVEKVRLLETIKELGLIG